MQYVSTRGDAPAIGFIDAVLAGLAPDGGLYSPAVWPLLTPGEIAGFAGKPYAVVAAEILSRFAGDAISKADLLRMTTEAYATFNHAAVAPLKQLEPGLWLLELFHGPTLAFKDVAMQILSRLYEHALAAKGRTLTIVCATSGDTGGAAVEALRGRDNVRIVALFPEGRISEVQRRFMTTAADANVRCLAIKGDFDDCQTLVKGLFQAQGFREAVDLSGVNSINWARIAAQVVYYFTAAVALGAPHRKIAFAVPTGNFGDAFAGYVAHRMGLPIERIILATNGNDILARAVNDGRYARGAVRETQSPAMDIQIASNFERLYFELVDRQGLETAQGPGGHARAVRGRGDQRARHRPGHRLDLQPDRRVDRPAHRRRHRRGRAAGIRQTAHAAGGAGHRPSGEVSRGGAGGRRGRAAHAGRRPRPGQAQGAHRPPAR
jgi:threonine synthase